MADLIQMDELNSTMEDLKNAIISNLSSTKLIKFYSDLVDGFIRLCGNKGNRNIVWDDYVCRYYEAVTGAAPYNHPGSLYLRKKARVILMIRDSLNGMDVRKLYRYNTLDIPEAFKEDIAGYSKWMLERGNSPETIRTRTGRVKMFLLELEKVGCLSLRTLTITQFIDYVSSLEGRYSSVGKSNILYTLRNYFTCPCISGLLKYDLMPLLTNLHTNKHERLESFYTAEEIRKVLGAVDRTSKSGKMFYLVMMLACVYGLRSYDIRTLGMSNIDWKKNFINLSQHKTKHYLQLPLTEEVKFALLDYIKNARPPIADDHVFIKLRSPHEPYSGNNHFSGKIKHYFTLAGINTDRKHAGLHSMRHSLASSLMSDKTPISEIAAILGHTSAQTTRQYIWSDINQLRVAAMEVPCI
ncbi:MAG TPA: integrase [Peptococcaceae bacterium]|jgi:integrase|nr:integrase [Peptococcaceae bacterium]